MLAASGRFRCHHACILTRVKAGAAARRHPPPWALLRNAGGGALGRDDMTAHLAQPAVILFLGMMGSFMAVLMWATVTDAMRGER